MQPSEDDLTPEDAADALLDSMLLLPAPLSLTPKTKAIAKTGKRGMGYNYLIPQTRNGDNLDATQPQPLFRVERAARQPVVGEPAHTSQEEGEGANEVETDHRVDVAALEAEMAAVLSDFYKDETPQPANLTAPRYFDDSITLNIGPE